MAAELYGNRQDLSMRIAVGANHRGFAVRDQVIALLTRLNHEVDKIETPQGQAGEYPEIAARVAKQVQQGQAERGILVGRTGMGMCLVANRFSGVLAAACYDQFLADAGRRYLDVNVLCLSADLLGEQEIERIVETWLDAPFEGGRHAQRIARIATIERE
jgi:ribose 5-phosphate isomerase B